MARPFKTGLDYFELDCHLDEKFRLIQAEFGLKGFALVVKLYQKIYGEFGYYCEWNKDSSLLFMAENGVYSRDEQNLIKEIVSACIRRNLFSEELFHKYGILTSVGVQKRYVNATSKRVRVEMKKEYLLLSDEKIPDYVYINEVNDGRNSVNDVRNTQSRVEKSREEKSKEIKHLYGEYQNVRLTDKEFEKLTNDFGSDLLAKAIKRLDEYIEEKGYKSKSHNLAIRRWVVGAVKEDGVRKGSVKGKPFLAGAKSDRDEFWEQAIKEIESGKLT